MRFEEGEGKLKVFGEVFFLGKDLIILLGGGEKPHVGSVAIALPRKSLKEKEKTSCTSSVYNLLGHKDEVIVRMLAEKVCVALNKVVVCAGGVHIENASEEEICKIVENCNKLAEKIVNGLQNTVSENVSN